MIETGNTRALQPSKKVLLREAEASKRRHYISFGPEFQSKFSAVDNGRLLNWASHKI